jgi:hypothetical protein
MLGDSRSNLWPTTGFLFDEDMPLRDGVPMTVRLTDGTTRVIQSPVTNPVDGAMALQQVFENLEWVMQASNAVAYAPHLRKDPLPGVGPKAVLFQFAEGDQAAPNPMNMAIVRAGDLADRTTFYRHDLAYAEDPSLLPNPHGFSGDLAQFGDIARAAQRQIATFLASDGRDTDDLHDITTSNGQRLFEVPIALPLPGGLNFVPQTKTIAPAGAQALIPGSPTSASIATNATSNTLEGGLLGWPTATTDAPADNPSWAPVMATSGSTGAAWTVPLVVPSALPISPPINPALDTRSPLARGESALDDFAGGLLRPARRRR